jgi:hypothetical protein
MNLFALAGLSVAVCCAFLSFITLFFGRTKTHRLLLFFNIVCALWCLGCFYGLNSQNGISSINNLEISSNRLMFGKDFTGYML